MDGSKASTGCSNTVLPRRAHVLGGLLAASLGLAAPFWIGAVAAAFVIPFVWSSYSAEAVDRARQAVQMGEA